jgi:hypothetical protein
MPDSYHNLIPVISRAGQATGSNLDSEHLIIHLTEEAKLANKVTDSSEKPDDKKTGGSYAFTVFEHRQLHALATNAEITEAAVDSIAGVH